MMDDVKDYPPYLDYPKPRKITTNADRIRSMPDEELEDAIRAISLGYEPWCDHHCKMQGEDNCNMCLKKMASAANGRRCEYVRRLPV